MRRGGLMKIKFYEEVDDEKLLFAVIVAKYKEQWVFCKHKQRNSYELCGGHREANESILDCARREFYEESGAKEYQLIPLCVYSCLGKTRVKKAVMSMKHLVCCIMQRCMTLMNFLKVRYRKLLSSRM